MSKETVRRRAKRGVSKDAKSKSSVPFLVDETNKFNIAKLKSITVQTRKDKETEDVKPVLVLHFSDKNEEREHYHTEWGVYEEWETSNKTFSVEEQESWQDDRMAHLYDTLMGAGSASEIGLGVCSDKEIEEFEKDLPEGIEPETEYSDVYCFFKKLSLQFNEGNNGKPVFLAKDDKPVFFWLKLVYDKRDNLGIPTWGNFVDKLRKDPKGGLKPTLLQMKGKDKYTKAPKAAAFTAPTSNTQEDVASEDLPDGF